MSDENTIDETALPPVAGSAVADHDWRRCITTDCEACDTLADVCDCQDPDHGFISNECPVHNWNPYPPQNADGLGRRTLDADSK